MTRLSPEPVHGDAADGGRSRAPKLSVWRAYRPFFSGRLRLMALLGISSFLAGLMEALLLVVVARLAFAIAGNKSTVTGLGPLNHLTSDVDELFMVAVGVTALRLLLQVVAAHASARLIARLTVSVRNETFGDYIRASWAVQASEDEAGIQDLLIRHVVRVSTAVTAMATGLSMTFYLVALVGSAVLLDPPLAVLIVLAGGLLFALIRPLTTRAQAVARGHVAAGRNYAVRSLESIDLSLEIRSFGVSDAVAGRLAAATEAEAVPIYRSMLLSRLVVAVYQLVAIAVLIGGLFAVYAFLDRALASLGAMVVILVRALNQSGSVQSSYHSMAEAVPFAERLLDERERYRRSRPPEGRHRIEAPKSLRFEGVFYCYVPDRPALEDVSFEVRAGEATGIIGPSGSGKSTLIQIILRLRHPDRGRYLIDGIDAREIENASWFDQIAFVPQDSRIFNSTIRDNIRFFRADATDDQVEEAARRAHVHDEIMGMPAGYDTVLGSRGGSLSGGQRQRISIARALVRRPSIIVLDEPTSALDMRSESLVHETLTRLKGSVTFFVIAHRLSTLNVCDRIMVLHQGRLEAFGPREELEHHSEFYRDALALSRIRS